MTPPESNPVSPSSAFSASRDPARLSQVQQIILGGGDLPTLPTIAMEVGRLVNDPLAGLSEIVRIIRNDPALTAKILRVANSAMYGMPRRVESLNMALVILGMREINNLVICISVFKAFPSKPGQTKFNRIAFWEHSAGCGEIARLIASKLHLRLHGVEFTAGLLHDCGKIMLEQNLHDEFMASLDLIKEQNLSSCEAERQTIGVDHCEIGAWLAEKWALPASITEVIRCHHEPLLAQENKVLTAVVHLANIFTKAVLDGNLRSSLAEMMSSDPAWEILTQQNPELIELDVVRFAEELEENIEKAREFIRIACE